MTQKGAKMEQEKPKDRKGRDDEIHLHQPKPSPPCKWVDRRWRQLVALVTTSCLGGDAHQSPGQRPLPLVAQFAYFFPQLDSFFKFLHRDFLGVLLGEFLEVLGQVQPIKTQQGELDQGDQDFFWLFGFKLMHSQLIQST